MSVDPRDSAWQGDLPEHLSVAVRGNAIEVSIGVGWLINEASACKGIHVRDEDAAEFAAIVAERIDMPGWSSEISPIVRMIQDLLVDAARGLQEKKGEDVQIEKDWWSDEFCV